MRLQHGFGHHVQYPGHVVAHLLRLGLGARHGAVRRLEAQPAAGTAAAGAVKLRVLIAPANRAPRTRAHEAGNAGVALLQLTTEPLHVTTSLAWLPPPPQ